MKEEEVVKVVEEVEEEVEEGQGCLEIDIDE